MKKTIRNTTLILGGLALALSIIVMPMVTGEGKPGWGTNDIQTKINL